LRSEAGRYFDNLPGLTKEISKLTNAQWDQFYQNLMVSSRISDANGAKIETTDLRTAVMILHYVEILMSVYDRDQNGSLNEDEIDQAAPRFAEFMRTVSPIKKDFAVRDFFIYLVFYGKKPTALDYAIFKPKDLFINLGQVSRGKILRVFKVLKDEAAKK
jgi:hypothetical protein